MCQSVLWNFLNEISRHFGVFRERSSVLIGSSMREPSDVLSNDEIGNLAADLCDISREVTASDSTSSAELVNI